MVEGRRLQRIGRAAIVAGSLLTLTPGCDANTTVDVSASSFPSSFPKDVKKVENSAVRVDVTGEKDREWNLSGVKVSENLIFSAGHGWRTEKNKIMPKSTCPDNTKIRGAVGDKKLSTKSDSITSVNNKQDIALIKTRDPLNLLPTAPVARFSPSVGDKLYFVNYQDTNEDADRNPAIFAPNPWSYPAKYGGIVLGEESGDFVVAIRKNYGRIDDKELNKGGSGGPVFKNGKLVGVATDTYRDASDSSVKKLEDRYDIDITGTSASHLSIALVEPVDNIVFSDFETRLAEKPDNCVA